MLTIHHSNHLDVLKELLVELISRQTHENPLDSEQILVQSPGMAQWLKLELAKGLGVAVGIEFPLPASFIWQMYTRLLPDVPNHSAYNKDFLLWKIMSLLDDLSNQTEFSQLNRYIEKDEDQIGKFQLSEKIADIFDQYLVYRPDWITAWESGEDLPEITKAHPWQPILWRAVVAKTAELNQSPWHRANMHERFIKELKTKNYQQKLPRQLFVFGISALPPHFVESLQALALQIDVNLMVTNPCRHYWGDERDPKFLQRLSAKKLSKIVGSREMERNSDNPSGWFNKLGLSLENLDQSGNPLLGSMGKLGRDYFHQLHNLDTFEVDIFVNEYPTTLLGQIQHDIFDLNDRSTDECIEEHPPCLDNSLQVHSCHSTLREIEVLHNQLLNMFEQDQTLTPKDVIVMLPDVTAYAPSIKAIFEGFCDKRFIPYTISDISANHEYPIVTAFLHLLELDTRRCTSSEILMLLETPSIQAKFQLTISDIEQLRQWIKESGIRWGLNPDHQCKFGLTNFQSNSWEFGLNRMLIGFAMPESSGVYQGIFPLDSVQGMKAEIVGQLGNFIDCAVNLVKQLDQERCIEQWIDFSNFILDEFFLPYDEDIQPLNMIREQLKHLYEQLQHSHFTTPLTRQIIASYLKDKLNKQLISQSFLVGQVNFCTLMPMRSIPFKVICLLGMNDGSYPRSIPPIGFDLISSNKRRGDRSRREDDRYLFLEALLSAQKQLYISYIGRRIQDNTKRIPSVLVSELLNYCELGFGITAQQMITEHPMQIFSPNNYEKNTTSPQSKMFSYAKEWITAASHNKIKTTNFINAPLPSSATHTKKITPSAIEIADVLRFFSNPCKFFFNHRLKVWFNHNTEPLEETECFAMKTLHNYQLLEEILNTLIENGSIETLKIKLQAESLIPYLNFGELFLDQNLKILNTISKTIQSIVDKPKPNYEINITINNQKNPSLKLEGWIKGMYQNGLLRYRPASIKGKDIIRTWIEHLCLNLTQHSASNIENQNKLSKKTYLIGLDNSYYFDPIEYETAAKQLSTLIEQFLKGHNEPISWFPQTSYAWLQARPEEDPEKAFKEACLAYQGTPSKRGEQEDAYIKRCFSDFTSHWIEFQALARTCMLPALDYLQEIKP